ncbi:MAG TPA: hypothetical protein VJU15_01275 [Gemmatimonadales bacterium]|nr:hypothetical protein [Gemmatimonadales bacterium]
MRPAVLGSCMVALIACGGSQELCTSVRDSAGIALIDNPGPDVPLGWDMELVATVQNSGDLVLNELFEYTVDADSLGHIVVNNNWFGQRVQEIDTTGRLIRVLTREGAGPGEVGAGVSISSSGDGIVSVMDFTKAGLVRVRSDGSVLPVLTLTHQSLFGGGRADGDTVVVHTLLQQSGTEWPEQLERVTPTGSTTLLVHSPPRLGTLLFCGQPMEGLNPMLTPDLRWNAKAGRTVVNNTGDYTIRVYDGERLTRLVRRNVDPLPGNETAVRRFFPDGKRVADWKCIVPPDELVRKRGVARTVQPIRRLSVDYQGRIWAERNTYPDEQSRVDLFDSTGKYLGTLNGFGAPLGFPARDLLVFALPDSVQSEPRLAIYRRKQ